MAPIIVPHPNTIRGPIEEEHNALRDEREQEYIEAKGALEEEYHEDLADLDAAKQTALRAAGLNADGGIPDNYPGPYNVVRPAITGTKEEGSTLTCSVGTWVRKTSHVFQWYRNGVAVNGATAATYDLTNADDNAIMKCRVTATNPSGTAYAESLPTTAIGEDSTPPPENTVLPVISGTKEVGSILTTTIGTWSNKTSEVFSWYRDGVVIAGATANTYLLDEDDLGAVIKSRVTATGPNGTAYAESLPTTAIAADSTP